MLILKNCPEDQNKCDSANTHNDNNFRGDVFDCVHDYQILKTKNTKVSTSTAFLRRWWSPFERWRNHR